MKRNRREVGKSIRKQHRVGRTLIKKVPILSRRKMKERIGLISRDRGMRRFARQVHCATGKILSLCGARERRRNYGANSDVDVWEVDGGTHRCRVVDVDESADRAGCRREKWWVPADQ